MIRLLKYLPVVLSVISMIRKSRRGAPVKGARATKNRRSSFRK